MNQRQALVFAILMQDIQSVSPDYLAEKLEACLMMAEPEGLLDFINLRKLELWKQMWLRRCDKQKEAMPA